MDLVEQLRAIKGVNTVMVEDLSKLATPNAAGPLGATKLSFQLGFVFSRAAGLGELVQVTTTSPTGKSLVMNTGAKLVILNLSPVASPLIVGKQARSIINQAQGAK